MKKSIGPGRVVAMFVVGLFCAGLLFFTGIANLKLLTRIYPDPEFVAFGLLALEGGTVVWTIVSFLTSKKSAHFGICLIGLAVDTLLSCAGFMYELSFTTGTSLIVQLPVIYVIGFAVVFNVGVALCYKLVPEQGNLIPQSHAQPAYQIHEQRGETSRSLGLRRSNEPKTEGRTDAELLEEMRNNPMYREWLEWNEQRGGEPARPLASHRQQSNQPKDEPANLDSQATIEVPQIEQPRRELKPMPRMKTPQQVSQNPQNPEKGILSEGVSLLTQKLRNSITNGKTAARVRGKTNETTNGNM